jgi:hypothetical protein
MAGVPERSILIPRLCAAKLPRRASLPASENWSWFHDPNHILWLATRAIGPRQA